MASQAQIAANRRNALLSTGPSTVEGKIAVSQNAFKHGLRSVAFLHSEEVPEYYWDVCRKLLAEYQPQTMTEEIFVERLVLCQAKLASLEFKEFECQYDDDLLPVICRRMDSLERSEERAVKMLHKLQKERKAQEAKAPIQDQPETAPTVEAAEEAGDHLRPICKPPINHRFLELMALGAACEAEIHPAPDHPAAS